MTNEPSTPKTTTKIRIERTYPASASEVWDLWTTRKGIESWWAPDGFKVEVRKLELQPGGELIYTMTATGPEQVEFMKRAGMPLTTESRKRFTELVAPKRIAYQSLADFIPGVEPYEVETRLKLTAQSHDSVRVDLELDAMHDEFYTSMATQGWEGELGKLADLIASRKKP